MDMMTMNQFEELRATMDKAQKDDTPFLGMSDDEIHVFGDPNKTEVVSDDYVVSFAFPNTEEWRNRVRATGDKVTKTTKDGRYMLVERVYKNAHLSPRNMSNAVTALTILQQFFNEITADGEVKAISYEKMKDLWGMVSHDVQNVTYELVSAVLGIPYAEQEWMLPVNTITNAVKILSNNPSLVNEADLFFE